MFGKKNQEYHYIIIDDYISQNTHFKANNCLFPSVW